MTETSIDAVSDRDLPSPGSVLRHARESRGFSVEEVAYTLKLTPKQVVAIEQDNFDLLPGTTFARGFVRNYARLMQLDAIPLLAALEHRLSQREIELTPLSNAAGTMPTSVGTRGVPRVLLVLLIGVAGALAAAVFFERFQPASLSAWRPGASTEPVKAPDASSESAVSANRNIELSLSPPAPLAAPNGGASSVVPPVSEPVTPTVAPLAPASPALPAPVAPAEMAQAVSATEESARALNFSFAMDSWVEVKDGAGKTLVSKLNKSGSSLEVTGRPPFRLVVGNAPTVQLTYAGKAVNLKPYTAVSVARFSLD